MLLDIQHLGAHGSVEVELHQFAIHLGLVPATAWKAREGAAQILATMRVKVAQETTKTRNIADASALLGIGPDKNDSGGDLGPGPEYRRRQLPYQAHVRHALNQYRQGAVFLAARSGQETLGDLPLHRDDHALERQARNQEIADDRHSHGVGQVRHELNSIASAFPAQLIQSHLNLGIDFILILEHVGMQDSSVVALANCVANQFDEGWIEL